MKALALAVLLTTALVSRTAVGQKSVLEKAQDLAGETLLTLDGDWVNADPASSGIVRIVVSGTKLHAWGSCRPKACDMGVFKGQPFASTVDRRDVAALLVSDVTRSNNGVMTVSLDPDGRLRVQRFNHYGDGRRSDLSVVDYFVHEPVKP